MPEAAFGEQTRLTFGLVRTNITPPNRYYKLSTHQSLLVFVNGFFQCFAAHGLRLDILLARTEHPTCFGTIELLLETLECAFDVFSLLDRNDEHDSKLGPRR